MSVVGLSGKRSWKVKARAPRLDGTKWCLACRRDLPMVEFGPSVNSKDGRAGTCRSCENKRRTTAKHGLTREQKAEIARQQGGCLICRRTAPSGKGWVMDHDRSCCSGDKSCAKCRRGILCHWCNSALGYAMDSPELLRRLADYLEQWNASRSAA